MLANQQRDQRIDKVFDKGGDDRSERRANHHADRQVHYIAAQNKLLKARKHAVSSAD